MLAPIVIFVYNRPEHTMKTIETLAENLLAKDSEVYIFSDGPKDESSLLKVESVRRFVDSLRYKDYFKSVTIEKSEHNKGLARSVINGVSKILNEYDKVIVLEDDLLTSRDFLVFMNDALEFYKNNPKIWSISGYSPPIKIPSNYKSQVYYSYRASSWGWATWRDRWEKVDWEVSDYDEFMKNKKMQNKFNRGGLDMSDMLKAQMEGKIDSWAIRWCYTQSKLDMYTVYPVKSRVRNIGLDGTGTHRVVSSKYDMKDDDNRIMKCEFDDPGIDPVIVKRFKYFYMSRFSYFVKNVKEYIKSIYNKIL